MTMFGRLSVCLSVCRHSCNQLPVALYLVNSSTYQLNPSTRMAFDQVLIFIAGSYVFDWGEGLKTGNRKRRTGKRGNIICMGSKT